jgi:hypothetical protein
MKKFVILDNNGETFDRYTIIDTKTGDCWGASDNPFHPQGLGQYCGNIADNYFRTTFGVGWRKGHDERGTNRLIRSVVEKYITESSDKEIERKTLPKEVQQYIKQLSA